MTYEKEVTAHGRSWNDVSAGQPGSGEEVYL